MTGLNVVKKLNFKNINIFIVNGLSEYCSKKIFKYSPMDSLLINNKNEKNDLFKKFIGNYLQNLGENKDIEIKAFKGNEIYPKYPETSDDAKKRYRKIGEELYNKILKNDKNSLNIIVTHGFPVRVIKEYFFTKTKNEQELPDKKNHSVNYCTSYHFDFINEKEIKFMEKINPSYD